MQGYVFNGSVCVGPDVRYAFPDPVLDNETAPNFLSIKAEGHAVAGRLVPAGLGRHSPEAVFPNGLPQGGKVAFTFGDRSKGAPGLAVPTWPMKIRFIVFMDCEGDKSFVPASGIHPAIEVSACGADRFKVVGPSITHDARISLRIVPVRGKAGRFSSELPVRDFSGKVNIFSDEGSKAPLGEAVFEKEDRFKDVWITLPGPGIHRLVAMSGSGNISGKSNPVLFMNEGNGHLKASEGINANSSPSVQALFPQKRSVFWGSLQNHTAVGGHAASLPADAFRCARGQGCLDFCAITDHSSNSSFHWEELRDIPDRFDEPGRFVAFAGYEWTSSRFGHRHVILKEGAGSCAYSELPTSDAFEVYAPDLESFALAVGRDPNVIIIPHHTRRILENSSTLFDFGKRQDMQRQLLFEIFSWQGGSEGSADDLPIHGLEGRFSRTHKTGCGFRDALDAGYRFGVTSDSDGHLGLPGVPVCIRRKNGVRYGYRGITGVFSGTLDREGVFRALEKRACFGTTGERVLLSLWVEDAFMGEETASNENTVKIRAAVFGTAPIERVEIVANGKEILFEQQPGALDVIKSFNAPGPRPGELRSFYLRMEQSDGHKAWSSPVWVKGL